MLSFLFRSLMGLAVFLFGVVLVLYFISSLVLWGVWYVQFDPEERLLVDYIKVVESKSKKRRRQVLYVEHRGELVRFASFLNEAEKRMLNSNNEKIFLKFYRLPIGGKYIYHIYGADSEKVYYLGKPTLESWIALVVLFIILLNVFLLKILYGNLRRYLHASNR